MNPQRIVDDLAAAQHGMVTRQQLLAAGLTARMVSRWLAAGRLRLVHRGVYQVGPVTSPLGPEQAALLACGKHAVLSHWTAARLAGLPCREEEIEEGIHVTVPRSGRRKRRGIRVYRSGCLHPGEVGRLQGLALTTVARTLLDLAEPLCHSGRQRRLEQMVAVALDRRLTTEAELLAVVARHAAVRGARLLKEVLGIPGGPGLTLSDPEEELDAFLAQTDLPQPALNAWAGRFMVDALWAPERFIVEVDGFAAHSSRTSFEKDRERDAVLATAGYTVMRVTAKALRTKPLKTVARIAWMLGRLSPDRPREPAAATPARRGG
jgi:predicted transcriptional regulator of viral defense system